MAIMEFLNDYPNFFNLYELFCITVLRWRKISYSDVVKLIPDYILCGFGLKLRIYCHGEDLSFTKLVASGVMLQPNSFRTKYV